MNFLKPDEILTLQYVNSVGKTSAEDSYDFDNAVISHVEQEAGGVALKDSGIILMKLGEGDFIAVKESK